MKVSELQFRELYKKVCVIDISNRNFIEPIAKYFQCTNNVNAILAYGYIDHEAGFTFEVLAPAKAINESITIYNGNDEVTFKLRRGSVAECELIDVSELDLSSYEKKINIINDGYVVSEGISLTRDMLFLDECRNEDYPDDVMVVLFHEGYEPEGCWVRCIGAGEKCIRGILLNEPNQDFSVHIYDVIEFGITKTDDNRTMCIALL